MNITTRQTVYGPGDGWHLTCRRCGRAIYPGEMVWVEENGDEYIGAECLDHRG